MMKKMKRAATFVPAYEDQRALFKYRSLLQDYEELCKETEAKKQKLEMMKQRKLTLLDEVRFLRRRYKYLMQNQSENLAQGRKSILQQTLVGGGRSEKKGRNYKGSGEAPLRCPAPRPDSSRKGKIKKEQAKIMAQCPAPILDLNQKQKVHMIKEVELRNSSDALYLSQRERLYNGKEATVKNNTPVFDLNQISREEEELQANGENKRLDELQIDFMSDQNDDLQNDMKLSACRSIGSGSSQAGKRKISWQDPVALRV